MERREFIVAAALGATSLGFASPLADVKVTTAQDLQNWLRGLHPISRKSVDRIIIGNPETKLTKVGTCWTPYLKTLKQAHSMGINVMVTHEPTFYTHWDLDEKALDYHQAPSPAKEQYFEAVEIKKKWIEDHGMVIIRSHDVPDILKKIGMPFALGNILGFTNEDILASKDYINVYKIKTDKAGNVAKYIASKLKEINQPGVAFYGDPEREVSTIGVGTGCNCDPMTYAELNPDLTIGIDDTIRTWIQTTYSEDTGKPMVVINHGTSEDHGMKLLNDHMKKNIPGVEFIHFMQGCSYSWITG